MRPRVPHHLLLLAAAAAWLLFLLAAVQPAKAAAASSSSLSTPPSISSRVNRKEAADLARKARRRREESDAAVQRGRAALPPLPEALNVSILTWNMGEKSPPMTDVALLAGMGLDASDLTVLGVQEVENLKPRRHEGSRSREWRRLVLKALGRTHALLSLTSLGGLQLAVLAKKSLVPYLSPLHICEVPCGVGNVLHNKGAQAALFRVGVSPGQRGQQQQKGGGRGSKLNMGTSFLFVNAHLAAHQHKVEERNADVDRVMTEMQSLLWFHLNAGSCGAESPNGGRGGSGSSSISNSNNNGNGRRPLQPPLHRARDAFAPEELVGKVDRLFFFGDLNYRLELPREDVEIPLRRVRSGRVTQAEAVARMLEYDQLGIERGKQRIFQGLDEPHVGFLPTFKFNKGRDNYDTSPKRRAPAWTDRVLFKPCAGAVECLHYNSVPACRHSDHRPVLARFRVALRPPPAPPSEEAADSADAAVTAVGEEEGQPEAPLGRGNGNGGSSSSLLDDDEEEEDLTEAELETEDDSSSGAGGESGYASDEEDSEY